MILRTKLSNKINLFREGDAITYHSFLTCGPLIQNKLEFGVLVFKERRKPEYPGENLNQVGYSW